MAIDHVRPGHSRERLAGLRSVTRTTTTRSHPTHENDNLAALAHVAGFLARLFAIAPDQASTKTVA